MLILDKLSYKYIEQMYFLVLLRCNSSGAECFLIFFHTLRTKKSESLSVIEPSYFLIGSFSAGPKQICIPENV
jgi:hypothetical protein